MTHSIPMMRRTLARHALQSAPAMIAGLILWSILSATIWIGMSRMVVTRTNQALEMFAIPPDAPETTQQAMLAMQGDAIYQSAAPILGVGLVFVLIVLLASWTYFLIITTDDLPTGAAFLRTTQLLFPMFALSVLIFLSCGTWLALLPAMSFFVPWTRPLFIAAVVLTIIILPFFALAPALLVRERCSVLAAVRGSIERSRGRWMKILIAMLGVSLVLQVFSMILFRIIDAVGRLSHTAAIVLTSLQQQVILAAVAVLLTSAATLITSKKTKRA